MGRQVYFGKKPINIESVVSISYSLLVLADFADLAEYMLNIIL
jgi:hypothetical protein